ncbi:MAG: hypothetical protein WA116_07925 [Anaerolineaceae bacterium]
MVTQTRQTVDHPLLGHIFLDPHNNESVAKDNQAGIGHQKATATE